MWSFIRIFFSFCVAVDFIVSSSSIEAIVASTKANGMAAIGVAYPQDALSAAHNPAGLADIGSRWGFGLTWGRQGGWGIVRENASPSLNGTFSGFERRNLFSPEFGISKAFYCCPCDIPLDFSLGFIVYNRDHIKTTYSHVFAILGTSPLKLDFAREVAAPVLAVKIGDCHSIGIALNFNVQYLNVMGAENFDNATRSEFPGHVTNRGYDYATGVGVTLGWSGYVAPCVRLGLAYQHETCMSRFDKYKGFLAERGKLNVPQTITAGILLEELFLPCMNVALDVQHIAYGDIKALSNPLLPNLDDSKMGRNDGLGYGFRDQVIYRVGADYRFACWTFRAGFRHGRTPVRPSETAVNLTSLDVVEDYVTLGLTWDIGCGKEISVCYAHGFLHKVRGSGSVPAAFGGGEVDLQEYKDALAISFGMCF